MGVILGGTVRVGLEDSLTLPSGKMAESNADQVAKIKTIIEELGYDIATTADVRQRLALKGRENVKA